MRPYQRGLRVGLCVCLLMRAFTTPLAYPRDNSGVGAKKKKKAKSPAPLKPMVSTQDSTPVYTFGSHPVQAEGGEVFG
jgi:hypothetical protein